MHNQRISLRGLLLLSSTMVSLGVAPAWAQMSSIDTSAPYYLSSQLGITVRPDFQGGTLRIDEINPTYGQDFNVEAYPGNTIELSGGQVTFSGVFSGAGSLQQIGNGTTILTGTYTYAGDTTITDGTLQIGNGGTTGTIVQGWPYSTRQITNNGMIAFDHSDRYDFNGSISGTGSLQQIGTGTLSLNGINTYTGGTTISSGTLEITTSLAITGDIVDNGKLVFGSREAALIYRGDISGSGSVQIGNGLEPPIGFGLVNLTGTNTYTGGTTISGSTLRIGNGGTTGSIVGNIILSDHQRYICRMEDLRVVCENQYVQGLVEFDRSDTSTFGGAISGTGNFAQIGTGTLILTGTSTFTGQTSVSGTLQAGADNVLSPNSPIYLSGGAVLDLAGHNETITGLNSTYSSSQVKLGAGTLILTSSSNFGGVISGTGSLIVTGGTHVLYGANTYTGGTTIQAGTLQIGNDYAAGSIVGDITDNGTLVFYRSSHVFSGAISGTGSVLIRRSDLTLTGTNTYTGGTTIEAGRTLQIGGGGTSGSIGGNIVDNGHIVFNRSDTYTFSGAISGTGSLQQIGSGTLILTGTNTFTGGTTISAGTLQLGGANKIGSITGDIVDNSALVYAVSYPTNRGGSHIIGSNISGSGSFTMVGGETLSLTGTSSFTGGTTIEGSTLVIGNGQTSGALAGNVVLRPIYDTAFLQIDSGPECHAPPYCYVSWTGVFGSQLGFNRSDTIVFAGNVVVDTSQLTQQANSDDKALGFSRSSVTQAGTGTLVLTGTVDANLTIQAGTVQVGSGGTTGSIGGDVNNSGMLAFNRSDTYTFGGAITGSGSVQQIGSGTLILIGDNLYGGGPAYPSYTGGTTISSGTLQIGNGGTTGSIGGNVVDNSVLAFNRSDTYTFAGTISGTGSLQQIGSGTLILTGTNTYSGITTVNSGTMQSGAEGALSPNSAIVLANSGTAMLDLASHNTTIGGLSGGGTSGGNIALGSATLTVKSGGIYSGRISGTGGVTVASGSLTLNGVNSYSGVTQVAAGTLVVGDQTHSGAVVAGNVAVASGATLQGYGTIRGAVSGTGTVSPGSSIGTLTVASYAPGAGGTLKIEITPTTSDTLAVTGAAALNGTLALDFAPGSYVWLSSPIMTAQSITGQFASVVTTGTLGNSVYALAFSSGGINLIVQPVQSGQIYSDVILPVIDSGHDLNAAVINHARGCTKTCSGMAVWSSAFGGAGATDSSRSDVSSYSTRTAGIIGGADYGFAGGETLGVAISYHQTAMGIAGGWGKALTNSVAIAVNGELPLVRGRLGADIFYMSNAAVSHRNLGSYGVAIAHPGSFAVGGALQIQYPFQDSDVTPLVRISVVQAVRSSSTESGGDGFDLSAASRTYTSVLTRFGLRYSKDFVAGQLLLVPEVQIGVEGNLLPVRHDAVLWSATGSSAPFLAPGVKPDNVAFVASTGLTLMQDNALFVSLKGAGRISGHQRDGTISVGGGVRF
jgi:autotransporter-associated beta strand repeat